MIRDFRQSHYQKLFFSGIGLFLLGSFFDLAWIFLAVGAIVYLIWILHQQHRLISWLISGARHTPPESVGLWGVVFDHLYRVQRKHREQVKNYQNIVRRMRSSTEALADGIILLDPFGSIQWWNTSAKEILQLRKDDNGQLLTNLLREPKFIKYYNKQHHREAIIIDNPARPNCSIQINMTIFGQGEKLLLIRDVTRLRQLEEMRQDFVANASHELKTPLTVLKGHLENILDFADNLAPPVEKALLSMSNQTNRMNNLVNDLLLLTRLDNNADASGGSEIHIAEFLSQIAADASELSADKGHNIIVECETDFNLSGTPNEIRSAINNLVFNAVNYSPAGTDIKIVWKKSKKGAVLSVVDQGEGIDQHHIPRLTERFYRVDSGRSSEKGGTGLGLAIVKHALQHHEARLDISSKINKGSVFSCVFPEHRLIDPNMPDSSDEFEDEQSITT